MKYLGRIEVLQMIDTWNLARPKKHYLRPFGDQVFYDEKDLLMWFETAEPNLDDHSFAADIYTPIVEYRFCAIKQDNETESVIAKKEFQTRLNVEVTRMLEQRPTAIA